MISASHLMEIKGLIKGVLMINQIKLINYNKKYHNIKNKLKIYKE